MDDALPDNEFRRQFRVLATQYLNNLVARISGQLDNLLLFSALFSAINTAILVSIAQTPGDETNSILQSLTAYVLNDPNITNFDPYYGRATTPATMSMTAFNATFTTLLVGTMVLSLFAMLAKQWIIGFKPEVYGSPEEGQRELDRKVIHSELFYLSWVTETAPFVSGEIILFIFLGAYLDLAAAYWTIATSIPLGGLEIIAAVAIGISVIIAGVYEDWPYHNPLNMLLPWFTARTRRASRNTSSLSFHKSVGSWLNRRHRNPSECYSRSQLLATCFDSFPWRYQLINSYFNVQCVCWVLEISGRDDILRAAASMVCTFKDPKEITIILKRRAGHTLCQMMRGHVSSEQGPAEYAAALLHILVASEYFLGMSEFNPLDALKGVKCRSTGLSDNSGNLTRIGTEGRVSDSTQQWAKPHFVDRTLLFAASLRCMTEYGVEWHSKDNRFRWSAQSEVARGLIESNVHGAMTNRHLQVLLLAVKISHEIFKDIQTESDDTAAGFHAAKHSLWEIYRSATELHATALIFAIKAFAQQDENKPVIIFKESEAFRILISTITHHLEYSSLADWKANDILELLSAVMELIGSWVVEHPQTANEEPSRQVADTTSLMLQLLLIVIKRTAKRAEDWSRLSNGREWDGAVVQSFLYLADVCHLGKTPEARLRIQGLFDMSRRSLSRARGPNAVSVIGVLSTIRSWADTTAPGSGVSEDAIDGFLENIGSLEAELAPHTKALD